MRFKIEEKLSLALFFSICAFSFFFEVHFFLLMLLLLLRRAVPSLRPMSQTTNRRFWKLLLYFTLLSAVMVLVNGVFLHEGRALFRVVTIDFYDGGLRFGLQTGSRLLVLIVTLLVVFNSTSMKEIAGFLHRIGLPDQVVMAFLLTFHWLDQLPAKIQRIFTAQEARGAAVRSTVLRRARSFVAILTPLVLSSIVESIDRGIALELRGFHSRSALPPLRDQAIRHITRMTIILLVLSFAVLLWTILNRPLP